MRWILLSIAIFTSPVTVMAEDKGKPCCCVDEFEGEPDLFKRLDQIYAGTVEFLYWGVVEGGLDYALKMRHDAWGPTPSYAQGRYENGTYDFDPGVRLALTYFRAPRHWESKWQYTRMTSRGKNRSSKPSVDQKYLTGTWPQIIPNPLTEATSHLHFNYNVFDWMIDRVFFPNPHLRLRTVGGGLAAWMDQDWKVRYVDSLLQATTIRNKWHFVGAGLKSGIVVDWYWTGSLYMTAHSFFGVLMGHYSNRSKQTTNYQPDSDDNTAIPVRDASYKDIRPAMTAQLILGPSYQKNYDSCRLELFAGFEMNMWVNVNEIYRSTASGPTAGKETWINSSLLALYGLTTRITMDF
jgi:hypothetical protein